MQTVANDVEAAGLGGVRASESTTRAISQELLCTEEALSPDAASHQPRTGPAAGHVGPLSLHA